MRITRRAAFSFAAFALLAAAAVFSSAAHAQTTGICDRTAQVQTAILAEVSRVSLCAAVTTADLAALTGTFDLSSQSITSLKAGDFSGLTNVTKLDVIENDLAALPANLFNGLTNLANLDLTGNDLTTVPANAFSGLTNLRVLFLYSNVLATLPANAFSGLTNLQLLGLAGNALTALPENLFSGLTSLTSISFANNALTTLPENLFSGLANMEVLTFFRSGLTSLPANVFSGLTKVHNLSLNDNSLETLPANLFTSQTKMSRLDLGKNPLTAFPVGVFNGLPPVPPNPLDPEAGLLISGILLPSAPGNVRATPAERALDVTWSAVSGAHYYLSWKRADADVWAPAAMTALSATSYTISNLSQGAAYDVRVSALHNVPNVEPGLGLNRHSWVARGARGAVSVGLPSVPQNLSATPGGGELALSWEPPADTGGASATTYNLRWKEAGGAFAPADAAKTTVTTYTLTGLTNGANYEVEIAASNITGDSAWSAPVSAALFGIDVNRDGAVTAADGILIARYLLGVTSGDGLAEGQAGAGAAAQIAADIQNGMDGMALDVDGNGAVNATDGILTARYLLGLRGDALTMGFAGLDAASIGGKIDALRP